MGADVPRTPPGWGPPSLQHAAISLHTRANNAPRSSPRHLARTPESRTPPSSEWCTRGFPRCERARSDCTERRDAMNGGVILRVGGHNRRGVQAREWVRDHLNGKPGEWGYPSYDGYRTNDDPNHLCDGDLLAPMLLNVRVRITAFADLRARGDELDAALSRVPTDVDLTVSRRHCALFGRRPVRRAGYRAATSVRPRHHAGEGAPPKDAPRAPLRRASTQGVPRR